MSQQHYSYLRGRRLSAMLRLMLPLLLLAVSNAVDTSETSDKPNIVIILIDDMVSWIWAIQKEKLFKKKQSIPRLG